jgi:hypothetical protein
MLPSRLGKSLPASGFDGIGRISTLPAHVGCRSIDGWHLLTQKAQIDGELGAVMSGVQDAPPKYPDALAPDIKEGDDFHPPVRGLLGEEIESVEDELDETGAGGFDSQCDGKYFVGRWLCKTIPSSRSAAGVSKRMGATVVEVESSHVPMLSKPDVVIDVIRKAVKAIQENTTT